MVLTTRPLQSGISLFIPVDDVDAHYERAVRFAVRIVQPPTTHVFGERQYTATDVAGYQWTFSQSVADVDPTDWGAIVAQG